MKSEDEEIAFILVSFGEKEKMEVEENNVKEEVEKEEKQQIKRKRVVRHGPRLTRRKYDREKRKLRQLQKKRPRLEPPSPTDIFRVLWRDNHYYECRVTDFIMINDNRMYYDIEFIDNNCVAGTTAENIDSRLVIPLSK